MSTGKIIAIVLVVCGGLGVMTIGSCVGLLYMGFKTANASVEPEINRLFAAIENETFANTYDTDTTQEFRKITSREQYADIGKVIATRLGHLKNKSLRSFNMRQLNADSFVDISYNATFEKGNGTITAKMKRAGGEWKLVSFHVGSPVFEQDLATAKCTKCGAPHTRNARFCPSCGTAIAGDDAKSAESTQEHSAEK
jgi:hypothetical protein